MSLRSLGGGELNGDRLVRLVYLDEAGISNPKNEPYVVVAGVIVHADKQWKSIEKYLRDMIADLVPPERRDAFYFHAKDQFHGTGKTPRDAFSQAERWRMIEELCSIPKRFDLPVVMGYVERSGHASRNPGVSSHELTVSAQAIASTCCMRAVERYMRVATDEEEVASLIFEDTPNAKNLIRETQAFLRSPEVVGFGSVNGGGEWDKYLPFERIVDSAHFAGKRDTSILQIADVCAFAIKRKLQKAKEGDIFFKEFKDQLIVKPRAFCSVPE